MAFFKYSNKLEHEINFDTESSRPNYEQDQSSVTEATMDINITRNIKVSF